MPHLQSIQAAIEADSDLKPFADAQDWTGLRNAVAAKTIAGPRQSYYINYRTIMGVAGSNAPVEVLGAYLSQNAPVTHQIMLEVGQNDGGRGGMDVSAAGTQAFLDNLPNINSGFTTDDVAALKSLGTTTVPWLSQFGFAELHEGDYMAMYGTANMPDSAPDDDGGQS